MAKRKRKATPKKKEPAMRITAGRKREIERLAEALSVIAPSTARGNSFCVQRVAEDKGLKRCWKKQSNKKKDIAHLLENTFRQYPQKPKALVLAIVYGGVEWMARKGNAATQEHLDAIAEPMEALGFRVRKELNSIEFPEPSRVSVPPQDQSALIDRLELHKTLTDDCTEMFRNGHMNEAVRKALERFEKCVQDAVGDHKTSGTSLMAKAFKKDAPAIPLNDLKTNNDSSEQEGFMHLTMGAMSGMRNLYSHGDVAQMCPQDALERLAFVSLLFKRVEQALKIQSP